MRHIVFNVLGIVFLVLPVLVFEEACLAIRDFIEGQS
jgi:hypothetical protein